jgi:cellulose biosynthesis protein BcsQ
MSHILAVAMQKGGVGKTTTTLAVGSELARLGARVLLIDLDPQSNLTQALGYDPTQIEHSVYELLLNPESAVWNLRGWPHCVGIWQRPLRCATGVVAGSLTWMRKLSRPSSRRSSSS